MQQTNISAMEHIIENRMGSVTGILHAPVGRDFGRLDTLSRLSETLGSYDDHIANFERIMGEIKQYRNQNAQAQERYEKNIAEARRLVDNLPLIHLVRPEHVENAKAGLKPTILLDHETVLGADLDVPLGLDNYVFASFGHPMAGYKGVPFQINSNLLDREGSIFTLEDIAVTLRREFLKTRGYSGIGTGAVPIIRKNVDQDREALARATNTYKKGIMPASKFKEFMAEFIATYYENPANYGKDGRPDIKQFMIPDVFWNSPEIKIYGEIRKEDITPAK